jgi:hypothetical protein
MSPPSVVEMHGFYCRAADSLKERIESLESSVFGIVILYCPLAARQIL